MGSKMKLLHIILPLCFICLVSSMGVELTGHVKISLKTGDMQDVEQQIPREYENVTENRIEECGGYGDAIYGPNERHTTSRGYTTKTMRLWEGGVVPWSFVSNGDENRKEAFYQDSKIGLSKSEVDALKTAMQNIQKASGCIRFKLTSSPDVSKPWMLFFREANKNSRGDWECHKDYIKSKLRYKEIGKFRKPFAGYYGGIGNTCGGYAYFSRLGADAHYPTYGVWSQASLHIGIAMHEILHGLGVGHTQKRPDRDDHIDVLFNNIKEEFQYTYEKCKGYECLTHGTEYDCSSIMHYHNGDFGINGRGTMVAKDPRKCQIGSQNKLRPSDGDLLRAMYKCDKSNKIKSPNNPLHYPNNMDETYALEVAPGSKIELKFTSFDIEKHTSCIYDYVEVLDSDGSQIMKECGHVIPDAVTSKSNTMTVKFHSDNSVTHKGFHAVWRKV